MNLSKTKQFTKAQLLSLHLVTKLTSRLSAGKKSEPFLCVITPVFDPALTSLKKLILDLKNQTQKDFIHVMVSNGKSPKIEKFTTSLQKTDPRFLYVEIEYVPTNDFASTIANSGFRRDYCLRHFNADRYLFLDADVHIVDNNYFSKLYFMSKASKGDVLVTNINYHGTILPIHPVDKEGQIAIGNYCFSKEIAQKFRYPTNFDKIGGQGNDYRYWKKISRNKKVTFLDFTALVEGEDRSYSRMSDKRVAESLGKELISVFGNSFAPEALESVDSVMRSHLVGYGRVTTEFENTFARYIGFKYGVATNSCTNAFWVLLKALNLKKSDEVIVPSIHFFGIKNVLELLGIKYTVVDVDEGVPNMNLESLKSAITKNTKVIIALDYGGHPMNVKKVKDHLKKIKRQDVYLILDAANSPFTKLNNTYVAKGYDFALYSFDMNKILVTGDGGMILSNNRKIIDISKSLAYYGILEESKSGFSKSSTNTEWWRVGKTQPSLKLAMNNLAATLGLSQLKTIESNLGNRKTIREMYYKKLQHLADAGHIVLPPNDNKVMNSTQPEP